MAAAPIETSRAAIHLSLSLSDGEATARKIPAQGIGRAHTTLAQIRRTREQQKHSPGTNCGAPHRPPDWFFTDGER